MPYIYNTIVEFADTDMAGIMHFSHFFQYMERAEHAFWRSLGLSVSMEVEGQIITWPRVHATCDYRRPLRFEDEIGIDVCVREVKSKAIVLDFVFRKSGSDEDAAVGTIIAVCVTEGGTGMKSVAIPLHIRRLLAAEVHGTTGDLTESAI